MENEGQAIEVKKETFFLNQNYPNPFNGSTMISFTVNKSSYVTLRVFDITGQVIKTLVNKYKVNGNYCVVWNGKDETNKPCTSGIYFYKISTNNFMDVKKMIFLE